MRRRRFDVAKKSLDESLQWSAASMSGLERVCEGLRRWMRGMRTSFSSRRWSEAHEDKTYRGAMIASMTIPWGFAAKSDTAGVGGITWWDGTFMKWRRVMAAGDRAAADRALTYLYTVQQKPDGGFPQTVGWTGELIGRLLQMDEVSYPMVLAWQLGRTDAETWTKHVRPEAEFVMSTGRLTQQERWKRWEDRLRRLRPRLRGWCVLRTLREKRRE